MSKQKNRPCPKCRELGRDKTGDHLYLLKDGVTFYCGKDCHEPYFERPEGYVEEKEKLMEGGKKKYVHRISVSQIAKLPMLGSTERDISADTHKHLRVRTELNEADRSVRAVYYPEFIRGTFIGYKCRNFPKHFVSVHKEEVPEGTVDFFGQKVCPASGSRVLITAGEEDYMAAREMLLDRYPDSEPAILGLPRGEEGSIETVGDRLDFLNNFEKIIVCTDMDQGGKDALAAIMPLLGEKGRYMTLSENDISDMRTKNKAKEFINAFFSAKEYRPSSIIDVDEILEEAIEPVEWGLSYPWKGLTELTYGLKAIGEIIGVGAAPGKTLPL